MAQAGLPSTSYWTLLVSLLYSHRNLWQNIRMMQELQGYCQLAMQALEREDGENEALMLGVVTQVYANCIALLNSSNTPDLVLRRYLKQQMSTSAVATFKRIDDGSTLPSTYKPSSLAEVFPKAKTLKLSLLLAGFSKEVEKGYLGRNEPELSSLYFHLS